jgi:Tol biopolymer transport system component
VKTIHALVLLGTAIPGGAIAQSTGAASVSSGGTLGNADSFFPFVTPDGRFVSFASRATNLVAGDTNGVEDVFLRDRVGGTTIRVSLATSGAQANARSEGSAVSADGRFVVFVSDASNLVTGDSNGAPDVFVRDCLSGTTELISQSTLGLQANGASDLGWPSISGDGRFVAFCSIATNLVPSDLNGVADAFVRDRVAGTTTRISVDSFGLEGNGASALCSLSSDGRFVAFISAATNLVLGDTNGASDAFVYEMASHATERVSISSLGTQADASSWDLSISGDGRFVVFDSDAGNLDGVESNPDRDIFVRDRVSLSTRRVPTNSGNVPESAPCFAPRVSDDGRFVSFSRGGFVLAPGQTYLGVKIVVCDREWNTVELANIGWAGSDANRNCHDARLSADGRFVVFATAADQMLPGDFDALSDIIVRDRGSSPFRLSCPGDGSAGACPCGNSGTVRHGCGNSMNPSGAYLAAQGVASVSHDTVLLWTSGTPMGFVAFVQGTSQQNGGSGSAFGDGLLCLAGTQVRIGKRAVNTYGMSYYGAPLGDASIAVGGGLPVAGGRRFYQAWYRNPHVGYCTAAMYNATNAVEVGWGP